MQKFLTVRLLGRAGLKIRASDGCEQTGFPEIMGTPLYYHAQKGDRLRIFNRAYKFNVATYAPKIDPRWIYTYDYAPDQSWTIYNNDLTGESYRQDDYIFDDTCYFRVCIRKISGDLFDGTENINEIIVFEAGTREVIPAKQWLTDEAERIADRVNTSRTADSLVFAVLADTHYVINGTWDDTAESIRQVQKRVNFDGIIHLGDITDGMVTKEATKIYADIVLDSLKSCNAPVWTVLGNHDSNYFRGNPERFAIKEQSEFYLDRTEPRYSIDFKVEKLRLVFLDSFDFEDTLRYGYSAECIAWLEQTIRNTPENWRAILFSHLPPVTRLQFWAKELRGEEEIRRVLRTHSEKILAWINGHNHADKVDHAENISAVSVINAKCEAFTEYKPEGFITPQRKLGTATQEAWDIMIINPQKIHFIRFGAGGDRIIRDGRAEWL